MKYKANLFSNRTNIKKIFINQYVIDCLLSLQDRLDKRLSVCWKSEAIVDEYANPSIYPSIHPVRGSESQ